VAFAWFVVNYLKIDFRDHLGFHLKPEAVINLCEIFFLNAQEKIKQQKND